MPALLAFAREKHSEKLSSVVESSWYSFLTGEETIEGKGSDSQPICVLHAMPREGNLPLKSYGPTVVTKQNPSFLTRSEFTP